MVRGEAQGALAVHLFELSKAFSRWYQENPVLRNEDPDLVVSRIALATAWLVSTSAMRPVMLATSMRHPSRPNGGCSHRATTESSPATRRRLNPGAARLNLGRLRTPNQPTYSSGCSSNQ
jgi:hypothetical protein